MYRAGDKDGWHGRQDPGSSGDLWHQIVEIGDLNKEIPDGCIFLGFCSDIGVKRNQGRVGAVGGPDAIRKALVNLAVHSDEWRLYDAGDVVVSGDQLEKAQSELARYVGQLLQKRSFPILLGGGHEISYGHLKGVLETYPDKQVGVINFDPHFDLRDFHQGAHSGSWAKQLFEEYRNRLTYLPVGINPAVNISSMFEFMSTHEQGWISMDEVLSDSLEDVLHRIKHAVDQVDVFAITLDLDVFSAGVAPGVSAANPYGVLPHHLKPILKELFKSKKVVSFDVAEMNPIYDNGVTAKLAASFIYDAVDLVNRPLQ